jgi:hypothetical protein
MKRINKFLDWLFGTRVLGPLMSGDILVALGFALGGVDMLRGEPSWLVMFLGVVSFVMTVVYKWSEDIDRESLKTYGELMRIANEVIAQQRAEIEALKAEKGGK